MAIPIALATHLSTALRAVPTIFAFLFVTGLIFFIVLIVAESINRCLNRKRTPAKDFEPETEDAEEPEEVAQAKCLDLHDLESEKKRRVTLPTGIIAALATAVVSLSVAGFALVLGGSESTSVIPQDFEGAQGEATDYSEYTDLGEVNASEVSQGNYTPIYPLTARNYAKAWGPSRALFDFGAAGDYPQFAVFNSFENNPTWNFEPDFISIRQAGTGSWMSGDTIRLEPGGVYDVVVMYHNNAPCGKFPTTNARLAVEFPHVVRAGVDNFGFAQISADNTVPDRIWSGLTFRADHDVHIRFNPDSAYLHHDNGSIMPLPGGGRYLMGSGGQQLGLDFDGVVAGCTRDSGFVMFQIVADRMDFEVDMQVWLADGAEWRHGIDAQSGDVLDVTLTLRNTGTTTLDDIRFIVDLQEGLEFVTGSIRIHDSSYSDSGSASDDIVEGGFSYPFELQPGELTHILFQIRIVANPPAGHSTRLLARAAVASRDLYTVPLSIDIWL